MTKITQSFIFAAGQGTRMKPLTNTIPKPLLQVKNKSIIDYIIEKLDKIDSIQKIIVNGFYLAEKIEKHLQNLKNPKIIFSKEEEKIETGGGLVFAMKNKKFDENQSILLINGDVLWFDENHKSEIEFLNEFFINNNCDIALGVVKTKDYFGYCGAGDFNLNEKNEILSNNKSENLDYVFAGLAIIHPEILKSAPQKCFSMSYFYQNHQKLNLKIKGIELNSKFYHIGDVESFEKINSLL